jgi:hypothetical protein
VQAQDVETIIAIAKPIATSTCVDFCQPAQAGFACQGRFQTIAPDWFRSLTLMPVSLFFKVQ